MRTGPKVYQSELVDEPRRFGHDQASVMTSSSTRSGMVWLNVIRLAAVTVVTARRASWCRWRRRYSVREMPKRAASGRRRPRLDHGHPRTHRTRPPTRTNHGPRSLNRPTFMQGGPDFTAPSVRMPALSKIIGLLGWKPGRLGPGGNPSACRWKAITCGLLGENQARHCLAVPAVDRGRACRGSAWRLGSFGPVCEARTSTCCLRVAVGILVIHGREDVNT
jgi:hypothetical protein